MKIAKQIRMTLLSIAALLTITVATPLVASAAPTDVLNQSCSAAGSAGSELCQGRDKKLFGPGSLFMTIINTIIGITGSIAVLMLVIGGLRYTISGGDSSAVNSAKNTILYAIIGIIIVVMSYAIVNFVLTKI